MISPSNTLDCSFKLPSTWNNQKMWPQCIRRVMWVKDKKWALFLASMKRVWQGSVFWLLCGMVHFDKKYSARFSFPYPFFGGSLTFDLEPATGSNGCFLLPFHTKHHSRMTDIFRGFHPCYSGWKKSTRAETPFFGLILLERLFFTCKKCIPNCMCNQCVSLERNDVLLASTLFSFYSNRANSSSNLVEWKEFCGEAAMPEKTGYWTELTNQKRRQRAFSLRKEASKRERKLQVGTGDENHSISNWREGPGQ